MNKMQEQVREFHQKFGHPVAYSPKRLTYGRGILRLDLIYEEYAEYKNALAQDNLVEAADALGDLLYVVFGAAIEHGFDMEKVVDEIHRANMSKLGSDGKPIYASNGKVLKGPDYQPPNLKEVLGL